MLKAEEKESVIEFLKRHPRPTLRVAETLRDGFVTCIKPIPTICGAELICNPVDLVELQQLVEGGK